MPTRSTLGVKHTNLFIKASNPNFPGIAGINIAPAVRAGLSAWSRRRMAGEPLVDAVLECNEFRIKATEAAVKLSYTGTLVEVGKPVLA